MAKHTPGPWRATGRHVVAEETEERLGMRVLIQEPNNRDDVKANLRLIAAAPDLLAALEKMLDGAWTPATIAQARAAVSKATGRPQ